jgi:glycine betaine/choline ABC-type transport system substrate-binding protein
MRYSPLPSKLCKVFERETLGLDLWCANSVVAGCGLLLRGWFRGCICQGGTRALLGVLVLASLVGCAPPRSSRVVIGAKNFTEQVVLGELLAQEIEAVAQEQGKPERVERRFYLAGSYICQQALVSGRIDGYVEYTGTALTAILKQPLPPVGQRDAGAVFETVRRLYEQRYGVRVGQGLGFENTFAMVVRGEDARRLGLRTISDVVRVSGSASGVVGGSNPTSDVKLSDMGHPVESDVVRVTGSGWGVVGRSNPTSDMRPSDMGHPVGLDVVRVTGSGWGVVGRSNPTSDMRPSDMGHPVGSDVVRVTGSGWGVVGRSNPTSDMRPSDMGHPVGLDVVRGYEFQERPDGLRGLEAAYGLRFAEAPRVMDLGLLYRALAAGQVDMVAGNSTDGPIRAMGFVVLEDDKHYFPPYEAVPLVREDSLRAHPGIQVALDRLAGKVSAEEVRAMNYAVDSQHKDVGVVVREFRARKGL